MVKMSQQNTVCVYMKYFDMGFLILFSGMRDLLSSYWALPLLCYNWFYSFYSLLSALTLEFVIKTWVSAKQPFSSVFYNAKPLI